MEHNTTDIEIVESTLLAAEELDALEEDLNEALQLPLPQLQGWNVVQRRLLAAQLAQVAVELEGDLVQIGRAHGLEGPLGDQEVALGHVPRHRVRAAAGERHRAGIISRDGPENLVALFTGELSAS